jgi:hypothetical protein
MKRLAWCLASVILLWAARAEAVIVLYTDKADFLADSHAESIGPFPDLGLLPGGAAATHAQGGLTFTLGPGSSQLYVGQGPGNPPWTTRVTPEQLAISGLEHLNVENSVHMYSLGWDFVEPQQDPNVNAPFVESIFTVSLFDHGVPVGDFEFSRPNDSAQFVGVWTDFQFTRAEIRETTGSNENEFFGEFYWCEVPFNTVVPEPSSLLLMGFGALGAGLSRRRKQS